MFKTWEDKMRSMMGLLLVTLVFVGLNSCGDFRYRTKNEDIYGRLERLTKALENRQGDATPDEVEQLRVSVLNLLARVDHLEVGIVGSLFCGVFFYARWRWGNECDEVTLTVEEDGRLRFVYDDDLVDLLDEGDSTVRRASHVEPGEGGWYADMTPSDGGPVLGPYRLRCDALTAELAWLRKNVLQTQGDDDG